MAGHASAAGATFNALLPARVKRRDGFSQAETILGGRFSSLAKKVRVLGQSGSSGVRRQLVGKVYAVAAPENPTKVEKDFKLSSGEHVKVSVEERGQSQHINLVTDHPSPNLILHWGVEGGKGYKGGWRLPGRQCRPDGTVKYKSRALQTPWTMKGGNGREILISLEGDEMSDALNFVLKDAKSGRWYDNNGSNFKMDLKGEVALSASAPVVDVTVDEELCGIWAYLKWELAGCPNRSQAEADTEFRAGIKELEGLVRQGVSMDEIMRVARGEVRFSEFRLTTGLDVKKPEAVQAPAPAPPRPAEKKEEKKEQQKAAVKEPEPKPKEDVVLGSSIGMAQRDYLKLIKEVPVLSEEKLKAPKKPLDFIVQNAAVDESTKWRRLFPMGSREEIFAAVKQEVENGPYKVIITTDAAFPLVLHWGIAKGGRGRQWVVPPESLLPLASRIYDDGKAAETAFLDCGDEECDLETLGAEVPLQRLTLEVPFDQKIAGIQFVLRSDDKTKWWKDGNGNFFVPLPGSVEETKHVEVDTSTVCNDELTRAIIECETNKDHWTLMHRFHKAHDLLEAVMRGSFTDIELVDATARIYCWLRYSATRQLTWQKNYNTKPRELSHSQERLTSAIANAHRNTGGETQEWVRLMLSTVGRGGDGQRIRDEILHIMHRNKIKEVKGLWMEEWHQKLHNNTTPDDVPICEAYIAFLESHGDNGVYWRSLSDSGITRQRLEGFDRAIKSEPQYYPDKRDALIRDMYNYLGILKAVHSGADLQASAAAAQNSIPGSAQGHLGYVLSHLGDPQILPFMEAAVEARMELNSVVAGNLDLMYLDLALENQIRQAAERGAGISGPAAAGLVTPLLQNLCLSAGKNEEICFCLQSWEGLPNSVRGGFPNQEEALQAVAVIDRIRRALGEISDGVFNRIGEASSVMGKAFGCEDWAVEIFSEEVVRGGPAFALSLVLGNVEGSFRSVANLGAWQVISPTTAVGRVVVVPGLHEVQDKVYSEPTILLADRVSGEEEIPEGVVGVFTPDAPDVLSHVSVRARNMKVLFATCHEAWHLEEMAKMKSKVLRFNPTASGEVRWEEATEESLAAHSSDSLNSNKKNLKINVPKWCGKWVVSMDEYTPEKVGAKSRNIAGLRRQIPDDIKLPSSVTVPFGSFEKVLESKENSDVRDGIEQAMKRIPDGPSVALRTCRELAMQIKVPEALKKELSEAMQAAGIPLPESPERWDLAMEAMKGVWASKFNDRAFFSMRKVGLKISDLRMAVLVQRIVSPEYAYVIHTKNPSTGNAKEIYCELVKGLGESLVSGMVPGSSMAFTAKKSDLDDPQVLLYPSKSAGMYVRDSLIFRSDSNGEDLEGYAGAGLYESITMDPTELKKVDYVADKLIQDAGYRNDLLIKVAKVGAAIEDALGSAQDIEGVVGLDGVLTVVQTRPQV
ncbi:hypothetical protein BSKO_07277 [Bryopsis sp. KO-2023]|nr:hypothetical protein BSKO_07277 [Bryopsis sp. KO-2023]